MKNNINKYLLVTILLLSACATELGGLSGGGKTPDIDAARNASFPNEPFKEQLRSGYVSLADYEWSRGNKDAARRFGRKAVATTMPGIDPDMEGVFDRDINLTTLNELLGAKYFVESVFVAGVKERDPETSAKAQLSFDCWVEQAASKKTDARPCKADFNAASNDLRTLMDEVNKRTAEQKQRADVLQQQELARQLAIQKAALFKMPEYSLIFFKFNSTKLGITGTNILNKVAADIKLFKPRKVVISGNTDNVGKYKENLDLAMARGHEVANYLIKNHGIDPNLLDVKAYGLNNPRVDHDSTQREIRNRYVQIIFLKDNKMYYDNDNNN